MRSPDVSPYQPREGLSTSAVVTILLGGLILLAIPVGLVIYLWTTLQRTSSAGASPESNRRPVATKANSPSRPSRTAEISTRNHQGAGGGATDTKAEPSSEKPPPGQPIKMEMGLPAANGDFIPMSSMPRSSEKIICRLTVQGAALNDLYSTYWYVDDVPGDRTGRLICDIHGKPFTEVDVRYAQQPGGLGFNFTLFISGSYMAPGLYRVEVVKNGQKLGFVRFRLE